MRWQIDLTSLQQQVKLMKFVKQIYSLLPCPMRRQDRNAAVTTYTKYLKWTLQISVNRSLYQINKIYLVLLESGAVRKPHLPGSVHIFLDLTIIILAR